MLRKKQLLTLFCIIPLLFVVHVHGYLVEDASPQWRNQKQSALVIPQGGSISLQAEGMDTVSLRKAVLSTNETTAWRNETEYAFLWMQPAVWGFDNFGTATYKDGVLYAPSKGDNNVYAVNASNGDIIWNRTVRQCDASPCIDGDVIYVGECSGPLGEPTPFPRALALNRTTGEIVWEFIETNNFTWVGSPLVNGDYIYYTTYNETYGTYTGIIYALNKTNGNPIWHQDIGAIVCSVAYDNGAVFVSVYSPPGQYAFNATTGEEIWHVNYGASWDASPVIYNGMVIQVTRDPITRAWSTYVLNKTNGAVIRRFEGKGSPSTPLAYDNRIFIPSDDWRMWAFNLKTGEELWHTMELHDGTLQNYSYCSPAAAGGAIYYQSLNGTFYVINETDGCILWSYPLGGFGFGSPSIGDGCVFITNDAALYAFKIGSGSGDWSMFCQNNLHQSYSEYGVEYVRWPLTQPKDFGDISNMWVTTKFVWRNKTVTSAAIAWRIYFFDSEGNVNVTDIKIFYVNMPIHNVVIVNVAPKETVIEQNQTTLISLTVFNEGNYTETFNLTLYYDSVGLHCQTLTLEAHELRILTFEWNTTGVPCDNYTISAYTSEVPEEADTQDNIYTVEYPVTVIPEFPSTIILITFLIFTLIAVTLIRKEKTRTRFN